MIIIMKIKTTIMIIKILKKWTNWENMFKNNSNDNGFLLDQNILLFYQEKLKNIIEFDTRGQLLPMCFSSSKECNEFGGSYIYI